MIVIVCNIQWLLSETRNTDPLRFPLIKVFVKNTIGNQITHFVHGKDGLYMIHAYTIQLYVIVTVNRRLNTDR